MFNKNHRICKIMIDDCITIVHDDGGFDKMTYKVFECDQEVMYEAKGL